MKTIVLIRHAKSSWEHNLEDIDRPLSTRGQSDAIIIAKEFSKNKYIPDQIFSSPANRALSTCHILLDNLNFLPKQIEITDELYDFGGNKVLKFLHNLNDDLKKVMIFGHNHAFTAVANELGDQYIDNLPTCGLVKISFESNSWSHINKGKTELVLYPKLFK